MKVVSNIYEKTRNYRYIKEFKLFRNIEGEECGEFNLKMCLIEYPCWDSDDKVSVVFSGIRQLKLGDIDNLCSVVMEITSISTYQLEGIRYEVREIENEMFSFQCNNIILE